MDFVAEIVSREAETAIMQLQTLAVAVAVEQETLTSAMALVETGPQALSISCKRRHQLRVTCQVVALLKLESAQNGQTQPVTT